MSQAMQKLFGTDTPVLLAPMAGVTDVAFRGICREMGADFSYTEMVSAKGLHYNNKNTATLLDASPPELSGAATGCSFSARSRKW